MPTAPAVILNTGTGYNAFGGKLVSYIVAGFTTSDSALNGKWNPAPSITQQSIQYSDDPAEDDNYLGRQGGDWVMYAETDVSTPEDKASFTTDNVNDPRGIYTGLGDSAGGDVSITGVPPFVITD